VPITNDDVDDNDGDRATIARDLVRKKGRKRERETERERERGGTTVA